VSGAARGERPLDDGSEIDGCHAGQVDGARPGDDYMFVLDHIGSNLCRFRPQPHADGLCVYRRTRRVTVAKVAFPTQLICGALSTIRNARSALPCRR
jgi:hypothetical protein